MVVRRPLPSVGYRRSRGEHGQRAQSPLCEQLRCRCASSRHTNTRGRWRSSTCQQSGLAPPLAGSPLRFTGEGGGTPPAPPSPPPSSSHGTVPHLYRGTPTAVATADATWLRRRPRRAARLSPPPRPSFIHRKEQPGGSRGVKRAAGRHVPREVSAVTHRAIAREGGAGSAPASPVALRSDLGCTCTLHVQSSPHHTTGCQRG